MSHLAPTPRFRAWNKVTNKMVDLYAITPLALDPDLKQDGVFLPFSDSFVLSQFTGILDRGKREVFDGDIVEGHMATGHGQSARKRLQRFLVAWNTWSHGWYLHTEWWDYRWRFFPSFGQCAVVGNRWENPEWVIGKVEPIRVPVDVL